MISDFLVCHPLSPFFSLTESEFNKASRVYSNLLVDNGIHYDKYSATVGINLGYNLYFDNETILNQFERLFQLLPFKTEYKGHDFGIVVDNARTHSAKDFSLNYFGKKKLGLDVQWIRLTTLMVIEKLDTYLVISQVVSIKEDRKAYLN